MRDTAFSNCESEFVIAAIKKKKRLDGRLFNELRDIELFFGSDYGCAYVTLGETKALAQVSCQLCEPRNARKNEGNLFVNVEINDMVCGVFETGNTSHLAAHTNRLVEKCIKDSRCVDLEALCIVSEEQAWEIRVDVSVLNFDGNLFTCCSLAALAGLAHFRSPHVSLENSEVRIESIYDHEPEPLSLHHYPILVAFAVFEEGNDILLDPTELEEKVCESELILGMNSYRELCGMHFSGRTTGNRILLLRASQQAALVATDLVKLLKTKLEEDNAERKKNRGRTDGLVAAINLNQILSATQDRNSVRVTKREIEETALIDQSMEVTGMDSDEEKAFSEKLPIEEENTEKPFAKDRRRGVELPSIVSYGKNWIPSGNQNAWSLPNATLSEDEISGEDESAEEGADSESNGSDVDYVKTITNDDRIIDHIELNDSDEEANTVVLDSKACSSKSNGLEYEGRLEENHESNFSCRSSSYSMTSPSYSSDSYLHTSSSESGVERKPNYNPPVWNWCQPSTSKAQPFENLRQKKRRLCGTYSPSSPSSSSSLSPSPKPSESVRRPIKPAKVEFSSENDSQESKYEGFKSKKRRRTHHGRKTYISSNPEISKNDLSSSSSRKKEDTNFLVTSGSASTSNTKTVSNSLPYAISRTYLSTAASTRSSLVNSFMSNPHPSPGYSSSQDDTTQKPVVDLQLSPLTPSFASELISPTYSPSSPSKPPASPVYSPSSPSLSYSTTSCPYSSPQLSPTPSIQNPETCPLVLPNSGTAQLDKSPRNSSPSYSAEPCSNLSPNYSLRSFQKFNYLPSSIAQFPSSLSVTSVCAANPSKMSPTYSPSSPSKIMSTSCSSKPPSPYYSPSSPSPSYSPTSCPYSSPRQSTSSSVICSSTRQFPTLAFHSSFLLPSTNFHSLNSLSASTGQSSAASTSPIYHRSQSLPSSLKAIPSPVYTPSSPSKPPASPSSPTFLSAYSPSSVSSDPSSPSKSPSGQFDQNSCEVATTSLNQTEFPKGSSPNTSLSPDYSSSESEVNTENEGNRLSIPLEDDDQYKASISNKMLFYSPSMSPMMSSLTPMKHSNSPDVSLPSPKYSPSSKLILSDVFEAVIPPYSPSSPSYLQQSPSQPPSVTSPTISSDQFSLARIKLDKSSLAETSSAVSRRECLDSLSIYLSSSYNSSLPSTSNHSPLPTDEEHINHQSFTPSPALSPSVNLTSPCVSSTSSSPVMEGPEGNVDGFEGSMFSPSVSPEIPVYSPSTPSHHPPTPNYSPSSPSYSSGSCSSPNSSSSPTPNSLPNSPTSHSSSSTESPAVVLKLYLPKP